VAIRLAHSAASQTSTPSLRPGPQNWNGCTEASRKLARAFGRGAAVLGRFLVTRRNSVNWARLRLISRHSNGGGFSDIDLPARYLEWLTMSSPATRTLLYYGYYAMFSRSKSSRMR